MEQSILVHRGGRKGSPVIIIVGPFNGIIPPYNRVNIPLTGLL
jgi:hypothetical protein